MNFAPSEWFGFNKRARHDMTFTKTINGETSTKKCTGTLTCGPYYSRGFMRYSVYGVGHHFLC